MAAVIKAENEKRLPPDFWVGEAGYWHARSMVKSNPIYERWMWECLFASVWEY